MIEPDEVRKAAAAAIADLSGERPLLVADLAAEGLVRWDLHRDAADTPRGRSRPVIPWDELATDDALLRAVRTPRPTGLLLVNTFPEGARGAAALDALRAAHPHAVAVSSDVRLGELLRDVIAHTPLTRWYDLVTLNPTPEGRLGLGTRQLFPVGARRGDSNPLAVDVEVADEHGTVLAVVASGKERRYSLVKKDAVRLAPGRYTLDAELRGPGRVRFRLPDADAAVVPDEREWEALVASVPDRMPPRVTAAHLVVAVEQGDGDERDADRLARAEQVVASAADDLRDRLRVSVLTYGPHAFERRAPDEPVAVRIWEGGAARALEALDAAAHSDPPPRGYPRAAALECALTEVARRLGPPGRDVRTAVLALGARPPFPPRVHPSEILPCPARNDWARALGTLRTYPGIAFGAIHDRPEEADDVWRQLGRDAPAPLAAVDARRLAASLGLAPAAAQRLPFPIGTP
ncbi:hypothetical protein [Actinomadura atramentaria]|uniref:hypothetical protein n=1 Tax=Actinomadura atramentaria TaxID=1990 RepID=UPI00035CB4A9|nr:hypothetical protein [Actinomadura atramentaria]